MSAHQPPPSLDQYPGYFPAAKPPFWTRTKVGVAAGVCGLFLGLAGSAGGDTSDPKPDRPESAISAADLSAAVDEATGDLEQQLEDRAEAVESAEAEVEAAQDQLTAYKKRTAAAQRKAAAAQRKAVAKAVAQAVARERAKAEEPAPPPVQQFVKTPSTDPQFGTCGEANDNGYGPYTSGVDPEYDWYDDRDDDGVVCER